MTREQMLEEALGRPAPSAEPALITSHEFVGLGITFCEYYMSRNEPGIGRRWRCGQPRDRHAK